MTEQSRVSGAIRRATRALGKMSDELESSDRSNLTADDWLTSRARMGELLAELDDGLEDIDRRLETTGARNRISRYLQMHLGQTVTKDELRGVAGISEWARRVRELREDDGWVIHTANTRDDLRVGEYVLVLPQPDLGSADRWAKAKRFKSLKTAGGAPSETTRLLEYLKAIHPQAADREQLAHVAGGPDRVDECLSRLAEDGWLLETVDREDPLTPRGSRLASLERTG